jgi:SAM-dependent methyltransferase
MTDPVEPVRTRSFGEDRSLTPVDRLGVWLSTRAVARHADLDGARLADVGCGYHATFVRSVLDRVERVTLVDVSLEEDLHRHPRVDAHEGPIDDVLPSLPDDAFDVVLCLSVLEHLWEPQDVLAELHRVTAPGGTVLVNVPTWLGRSALELSAFRLGLSPPDEMDDHKHYFDPRDLWPLLVRAGFRPSRITVRRHKLGLNTFAACRVDPSPPPGAGRA